MTRKIKKGRDAKTGKFVSDEFVKEHPDTTVTETIVKETKPVIEEKP
jgi:hypothetical protein